MKGQRGRKREREGEREGKKTGEENGTICLLYDKKKQSAVCCLLFSIFVLKML